VITRTAFEQLNYGTHILPDYMFVAKRYGALAEEGDLDSGRRSEKAFDGRINRSMAI